ncbi:ATP-dependent RNA helicase [Quillaja saponaria]|uniref:ATP-dependent RNA helicase n=1 Tax=Quillaja saponaria TaxID=32244 RepID=A0AAD7Q4Y4_QUISA|nr:ATP-dependent RNA helicase [Quillaja saponaria]
MAKGEDAMRRKKNKVNRKKLQRKKDSSTVSARVAAIIAAKKRRQSGKRRMCQGMCFSLPTPDDPFNDRHGKKDFKEKDNGKIKHFKENKRVVVNGKSIESRKGDIGTNNVQSNHSVQSNEVIDLKDGRKKSVTAKSILDPESANSQVIKKGSGSHPFQQGQHFENSDCPSKFLILCLNSIENALRHDGVFCGGADTSLFVNTWGVEFWKCYSIRKNVLDTTGNCSSIEKIAWMVSCAADTIARKEKEGLSFPSPFLLFLVTSQEKTAKVRSVCKPLKPLGIHTVSIHSGASIDHQIQGLKSCEPEFLVTTAERLLELLSFGAVDISGVSMLVVDGINPDMIKFIKQCISGVPLTVVFNDCDNDASIPVVQDILTGSFCRLSPDVVKAHASSSQ